MSRCDSYHPLTCLDVIVTSLYRLHIYTYHGRYSAWGNKQLIYVVYLGESSLSYFIGLYKYGETDVSVLEM